jgi:cell division protein FtsL
MFILMAAGVVRVSLAARAAEASIDAWELRSEVKAERQLGRTLEADRSALASPSRIEELACETLNMTRPAQVCYLEIPEAAVAASVGEVPSEEGGSEPARVREAAERVVATLADLAASEAEVLLVGDMGLGTLR